jgi:hypothetical protein
VFPTPTIVSLTFCEIKKQPGDINITPEWLENTFKNDFTVKQEEG